MQKHYDWAIDDEWGLDIFSPWPGCVCLNIAHYEGHYYLEIDAMAPLDLPRFGRPSLTDHCSLKLFVTNNYTFRLMLKSRSTPYAIWERPDLPSFVWDCAQGIAGWDLPMRGDL
jgi:hypothetical protein